ncbi:MAG TPA: PAN domain-containing protein [Kiloniellales bacterium]|nr:PAN domain-containing protein [Kiloniellales bacterium]
MSRALPVLSAALLSYLLSATDARAEEACQGNVIKFCAQSSHTFLGGAWSRIHVRADTQDTLYDKVNVKVPGREQFEVDTRPEGANNYQVGYFDFEVEGEGTVTFTLQGCSSDITGSNCGDIFTFTHYVSLPEAPPEPVGMAPPGEVMWGVDLWGNDYKGFAVQTMMECRDACHADSQCLAWTFVNAGFKEDYPVCFFKNPVPQQALGNRCCTSGIAPAKVAVAMPPAGEIAAETDLWGNDYNNVAVQSAFECRDACAADPNCLAWTFVQAGIKGPNAVCFFKNPIPTDVRRNSCCTSGIAPAKVVAAPAPAPAAPAPAAPAPAPAGGGVILADVDVYDVPGGGGNVIDFIRAGEKVTASPQDCQDGWCHIAGPNVPGGEGWIWAEGFLAFQ